MYVRPAWASVSSEREMESGVPSHVSKAVTLE